MLSPVIKVPLQKNCQEPVFRIDTTYSRQYTFLFQGIVFPRERNHMKNFLGKSKEGRQDFWEWQLVRDTYQRIGSNFTEQLSLNAENHITTLCEKCPNTDQKKLSIWTLFTQCEKWKILWKVCVQVILYCGYYCSHDCGDPFIFSFCWSWQGALPSNPLRFYDFLRRFFYSFQDSKCSWN